MIFCSPRLFLTAIINFNTSIQMKKTLLLLAGAGFLLAACNNQSSTTNSKAGTDSLQARLERNKAIVMESQHNINSKNIDLILKDCAPGFIEYGSGEGEPVTNMDSIKRSFRETLDAFDIKGSNLKAFASGDTVIATGTWSGTFNKAFMGTPPNGKSFKFDDAEIFVLNKEGKLISHRSIQTSSTILRQLGLLKVQKSQ